MISSFLATLLYVSTPVSCFVLQRMLVNSAECLLIFALIMTVSPLSCDKGEYWDKDSNLCSLCPPKCQSQHLDRFYAKFCEKIEEWCPKVHVEPQDNTVAYIAAGIVSVVVLVAVILLIVFLCKRFFKSRRRHVGRRSGNSSWREYVEYWLDSMSFNNAHSTVGPTHAPTHSARSVADDDASLLDV